MKRTRAENPWVIRQPINMPYMLALHTFVHTNLEISSCLEKKHREMFKTEWFVAWFRDNKEIFRPALFRSPQIRHQLEQFFMDMSDMLLIYGFAGYYCIRNMEKWVSTQPDSYLTTLPFGIIPLRSAIVSNGTGKNRTSSMYGAYAYYTNTYTMQEEIVYECSDDHLSHYTFRVFNNGAKFVPMYDSLAPVSSMTTSYGDLVPVSRFATLYRKKSLIEEAVEDQYDADFMLSHPQTFVTPKHIPDNKISDMSESMCYSADTLSGARHSDTALKQFHATESVRWLVAKLNKQSRADKTAEDQGEATRAKRKKLHGRCDQSDGVHTIAGYVDITQTHQATTLINIAAAQNEFEEDICNVIGLPYIFYRNDSGVTARTAGSKSGGGGGHSSNNEDHLNFYKNILYEELSHVYTALNRLFDEIYTQTYRAIDVYCLSVHIEKETEKKKPKKEKEEKEEDKEKDKEKEIGTVMVDLQEMAKARIDQVHVILHFEKRVARSVASLRELRECFRDGIVSEQYMRKYVERLYGEQDEDVIYSREKRKEM